MDDLLPSLRFGETNRRGVYLYLNALRPGPRRRTLIYASLDPVDALECRESNRR